MRIPLRKKKRTRYQRARQKLQTVLPKRRTRAPAVHEEAPDMSNLHLMTAGLFVAAGAEAALGERRGDYRPDDAIRWAPLVAAPLAGAAQLARAIAPGRTTRLIAQLVNGVALGVGAAGLASSVHDALREQRGEWADDEPLRARVPSLAPLAFGAVGLLGLLLDADADDDEEEKEIERPRKRGRVERIVIRV